MTFSAQARAGRRSSTPWHILGGKRERVRWEASGADDCRGEGGAERLKDARTPSVADALLCS